ncbi:hypothetical protein ALC56_09873 [Trachymyrmex septentrionalis]|uniref:Uncharacterized protein n=1 Tax=Trachymyrmex septentrionalis TaxID=34720 RepID=A0A151JUD7_9HYME|nr:hypothetical protein ALC56_09873 [Trachymyrmex septentrionalis]
MNASTETAPDIRVAVPLRDFLVRTFAPFRVNRSRRTEKDAGRRGEKGPFVSRAPTVNPVPVSVHATLPAFLRVADGPAKFRTESFPGGTTGPPIIDAIAGVPLTQNKISARNVLCTPPSTVSNYVVRRGSQEDPTQCILKANHRRCGKLAAIKGRGEPWRTITIILLDPGARDLTSGKAVMARAKQIYGN